MATVSNSIERNITLGRWLRNVFLGAAVLLTLGFWELKTQDGQRISKVDAQTVSFFDHFDGAALDARWKVAASGAGFVGLADSNATCTAAQPADACFFFWENNISKPDSQLWVFAVADKGAGPSGTLITLFNSLTHPEPQPAAVWSSGERVRISTAALSTTSGITLEYWDASHSVRFWNGGTNAWSTTPVYANSPIRTDDYYLVGVEIDGSRNAWRAMVWGKRSASNAYTFNQGLRLFTLTNWVSWAGMEPTDNLWMVLGDPLVDSGVANLALEWVRLDAGPKQHVWLNGKSTTGAAYGIKHAWGYESANGILEFTVPEDRTQKAVANGSLKVWDNNIKDPYVLFDPDNSTYYLYYSGSSPDKPFQIGVASSTSPNGMLRKLAGNPIIPAGPVGTFEENVLAPAVVKDLAEPDPGRRFKMLYAGYNGSDQKFRIFLATAPAATGPWTRQGMVLDTGQPGTFSDGGFSRPRPVYVAGSWTVFLGAKSNAEPGGPWRVTYAAGPSLDTLTASGVILVNNLAGPVQKLTAPLAGRIVKVADTMGFMADAYVEFDQDTQAANYGQSRIRKVVDATTLELYHGLDGFKTTKPARIVQINAANRIDIADVVFAGGQWVMYTTPFSFFGPYSGYGAHDENTGMLTAPGLLGPYSWNFLASPPATRASWNNTISNENMTLVHYPTGP
jgi:hypothetical protein